MIIEKSKKKIKLVKPNFMPQDKEAKKILQERADKLAQRREIEVEKIDVVNYIRFRLNEKEFYGLPYSAAREVLHHTTITKLPYVPNYIAGIINRRGSLITILDLKLFFNFNISNPDNDKHIIIFESQGIIAGLLVEHIEGSMAYEPDKLDKPLPLKTINQEYIIGLDKGLTAILNIETIMAKIREQMGKNL